MGKTLFSKLAVISLIAQICVLFSVGAPVSCLAAEKERIKWFRVDIPPVYIVAEEGQLGFGDASMDFMMEKLDQYSHKTTITNMSRGLEMLKKGEKVCFSTLLKNDEREKYVEFSVVSQLVLPLHLVIRHGDRLLFKNHINADGSVDLESLLEDKGIVMGVASSRSYSSHIDEILERHMGDKNLYVRPSTNIASGLVDMVGEKRVTCTLEFPVTVEYLRANNRIGKYNLDFIPIKGLPDFFHTYFAAPKNDWGKSVISQINSMLLQYRASDQYLALYEKWLRGPIKNKYVREAKAAFQKMEAER